LALSIDTISGGSYNAGAFGMPYSQTVRFSSSSASLVGKQIQVRVAAFANPADALPSAANQTVAYVATMPAGMITVPMLPTSGLHATKHLYNIALTYIDVNTFEIQVRFILKMDEKEFWTVNTQDNLNRLEKNVVDNPSPDNNNLVSVYSQQRELRIEATTWDGTTAENAVFQKTFQAKYFCEFGGECCEEFDCFAAAISGISYELFRSGESVSNFSAYDNTTIVFTAHKNAAASINKYYVALYRRDTNTNSDKYWNELNFNYAEVDTATIGSLSGSPFSVAAFVSATDFTQIGTSDYYEAEIELDASYFSFNGEYRAFVVLETGKGEHFSCNTEDIIANDCPDGVTGDVISKTYFHDKLSTEYNEDRFINVATRQRIRIDVEHDKTSYDVALNAALLSGSFNSNLVATGVTALDHMPTQKEILSTNLPLFQFEPDATTSGLRTIFRIPETWEESARFIVFWWKFKLTFETGACFYQVRKIISLTLTDNDEDITNYFVPTVKDDEGNEIEDRICDDLEGSINVCFDEALGDVYTFIPIIRAATSGNNFEEENVFENTNLVTLHADEIVSAEEDTDVDGQACMVIDPTELQKNVQYQVGGVFIPEAFIPAPLCINQDLIVTSEVTDITLPFWFLTFTYNLSGLTDAEITSVFVEYSGGGQNGVVNFTTATGTIPNIKPVSNNNPLTMNYSIFVILANGCAYEENFILQNFAEDGDIDTQNFILTPL
jgi:hypothetical protein